MTITNDMCHRFTAETAEFASYADAAISISGPSLLDDPKDSAPYTLQFEVVHTDATCRLALADTCVFLSAADERIRFVAPTADDAPNYVSYWHRQVADPPASAAWTLLSAGQGTDRPEVAILGQSLPAELSAARGSGFLHYVEDIRPGDGWTVRVGIQRIAGVPVHGTTINARVSVRPDWNPTTGIQQVHVA